MASGKMNERVKVYRSSVTQNEMKEAVTVWPQSEDKTLWAEINRGSGAERRVGAAQEQANLPATVSLRYNSYTSQIGPEGYRLEFDGLVWDIESAAEGKRRNREMVLIVRALVN